MADKNFMRANWLATTNIYEVNVRQYTTEGTFNAFSGHLPRLKDMGVEVLWFMPVHPIGEKNRKGALGSYYSIKDYKAVNPEFGTLQDFTDLVRQAHQLKMKVIIDWVANHTAWDNVWTKSHPEYFKRDSTGNFQAPWDWTDVIQIDHSSVAEQQAMIDAMKFWITECDIDGFRADLAHLTPLDFWKNARRAIEPLKPGLFWLAESEEINYHEVFDASYTWEWMHKTEDYVKHKAKRKDLDTILDNYSKNFPADAYRVYFTSNHDENSWNGTEFEKYGGAAGAMAVFSCTWNGIPMLYSGQELPNTKRLAFFEKDMISWGKGNGELHDFYKCLLLLRKRNLALRACDKNVVTEIIELSGQPDIFVYCRKNAGDEVYVFLNFYNTEKTIELEDAWLRAGRYRNIFTGDTSNYLQAKKISLPPNGYLVLEKTD